MAVLFITHKYPPATGGMEQQSFQLISAYRQIGESYTIIHQGEENIILFFLKLRYRVGKLLKTHPQINAIHLNDGLMAAFFILLRVKSADSRLFVTLHGLDVVFPLPVYQKWILPKLSQKMDTIICVSEATKTACMERNFPQNKLLVINNGVDIHSKPENYSSQDKMAGIDVKNDKIILAIGRPVKRKGFSWFANEVMPLLDQEYKFVHIGDIRSRKPLLFPFLNQKMKNNYDLFTGRANDTADLIKAAQNPLNRTFLAGRLSDNLRDTLIRKAECMVMPNLKQNGDMEGFGLVALEGAVMGKIVLAASIEGITDAIKNNKNGCLVLSGDAQSWASKIRQLSQIQPSANAFRAYTIDNYPWSKMVFEYSRVFQA